MRIFQECLSQAMGENRQPRGDEALEFMSTALSNARTLIEEQLNQPIEGLQAFLVEASMNILDQQPLVLDGEQITNEAMEGAVLDIFMNGGSIIIGEEPGELDRMD